MSGSHSQLQTGSLSDNARNRRTFTRARFGRYVVLAVLPALIAVSGCAEKRVPVFPVSGKITYKGKPAGGAVIVLHPVNSVELEGVAPSATTKDDGTFDITVYDPGDGAPQGDYVGTVQWYKFVPADGGAGPNVIPAKYGSPATSPIKVSVSGGPTQVPPIAIN